MNNTFFRRLALGLTTLAVAATLVAGSGSAVAWAFPLKVKSAILYNMTSRRVLYEQDADRQIPPASLTKILTLFLAFEAIGRGAAHPRELVTISNDAARTGGSSMNVKKGEEIMLKEVMKGVAIASGNDASLALAEHLGGDVDTFVEQMNKKARLLGMTDSLFENPHGLPAAKQFTSARDMLKLAYAYLTRYPKSLLIHSQKSYTHNKHCGRNSNRLLGKCDGVDGLKTGYVDASGFNIVATAQRDGSRLIAVVLGARTSSIRTRETRKLLEAGFEHPQAPLPIMAELNQPTGLDKGYYLQESAFRSHDRAENRAAALKDHGLPARVYTRKSTKRGDWHRVVLGPYADKTEAESMKREVMQRLGLKDLLIRKM